MPPKGKSGREEDVAEGYRRVQKAAVCNQPKNCAVR